MFYSCDELSQVYLTEHRKILFLNLKTESQSIEKSFRESSNTNIEYIGRVKFYFELIVKKLKIHFQAAIALKFTLD